MSSQDKLEFKIHSIERTHNQYKTDFNYKVTYTIKNISESKVFFFLNKNRMSNHIDSSLSNTIFYNLYENDTLIHAPVFNVREHLNPIEQEKEFLEIIKGVKQTVGTTNKTSEQLLVALNEKKKSKLLSEIITLEPNEVLKHQNMLSWNKLRNIEHDEEAFYLDPRSKFQIDFSLVLLKKPFLKYFTNESEKKLILDDHFIEGNFFSDKIEIFLD